MLDIGLTELLIIMAVALIVLGPKKLPEIARSLGRGLAEFRRTSDDLRRSIFLEDDESDKPDFREHPPEPYPPHLQDVFGENGKKTEAPEGQSETSSPLPDDHSSTQKDGEKA